MTAAHRFEFGSGTEYLNACKPDPERGSSVHGRASFTKTKSYEEAVQLARAGWTAGLEKVAKLTDGLTAEFAERIIREEWVPDIVGNSLDIGRFLAEEPDCWNRLEEIESMSGTVRRHVRIVFNGTASCNISTDVITMRGAAAAALVDLLELSGISVTLQVAFAVAHKSDRRTGSQFRDLVTVKPATERTDLSALMFWTAHPSALRRIAFARWEGMPEDVRKTFGFYDGEGYSYPVDLPAAERPEVYIGSAYGSEAPWKTLESTRRWIEQTLSGLGVHLRDGAA